jgi:hypothetical protein
VALSPTEHVHPLHAAVNIRWLKRNSNKTSPIPTFTIPPFCVHCKFTAKVNFEASTYEPCLPSNNNFINLNATTSSVNNNIKSVKMAKTGIFHHVGTFLLFVAAILLLITTISAPVIGDIAILKVMLTNKSDLRNSSVTFGTFGHCILDVAPPQ